MAAVTREHFEELVHAAGSGFVLVCQDLRHLDLSKLQLRGAHLNRADLSGANLRGAILRCANLTGAIMPDGMAHPRKTTC